jgi:OOP family OmpA-OmpF porin
MTRPVILAIGALAYAVLATYNYAFVLKPMLTREQLFQSAAGLTIRLQHGVAVLDGFVADEPSRLLLRRAAEECFGKANLVDDLHIRRDAPGGNAVVKAAKALPQMLSGNWMEPELLFNDHGAALSGSVSQDEDRDSVARLVEIAMLGTRIDNRLRVVPIGSIGWVSGKIQAALAARPIEFHEAGAVMRPDALAALDDIASLLKNSSGVTVDIRAHVNPTPSMDAAQIEILSQRRAEAVRAYLIVRGVPGERLSIRGFGASKPAGMPGTELGQRLNDRIEFVVHSRQ